MGNKRKFKLFGKNPNKKSRKMPKPYKLSKGVREQIRLHSEAAIGRPGSGS